MKKLFADQWVQLLVYTTLVSGVLTALVVFAPRPAVVSSGGAATASAAPLPAAAAPAPAPAPAPNIPSAVPAGAAPGLPITPGLGLPPMAQGSQSLVYGPAGNPPASGITMTPAPGPGGSRPSYSIQGAGVMRVLTAKTAGRWVVDGSGAADADTADPAEAVSSAKDGDEILIRPGTYKFEVAAGKKKLKLTGSGDPEKIVLENSDRNLFELTGAELELKNMTLRLTGKGYGEVIRAADSAVTLTDVRFEAAGNGESVHLTDSTLKAKGVRFHGGRTAVEVREHSKAVLENCSLEEHKTCLLVDGGKSELELKSTTVDGGEMGIYATKGCKLTITGSKFTDQDHSSVNLTSPGSRAEIATSEFSGSKSGLWIYENAEVTVRDSKFKAIRDDALFAGESVKATATGNEFVDCKTAIRVATRSTLSVSGGVISGSNRNGVDADDSSKLDMTGTVLRDNGGVAVYVQRQAEAVLKDVKILKTSDIGLFVGENASASLEKTTIDGSLKAGVSLGREARFKAVASTFSGNGRCGLALAGETATVTLRDARIHGNECAISFVEGGAVDSARGDFLGNKKGAFMFTEINKAKIALTGAGNKTK